MRNNVIEIAAIQLSKFGGLGGLMRVDFMELCDDFLHTHALCFWNVSGVSSYTGRSVHTQKPALAHATTGVLHGTSDNQGRVFTHSPLLWNQPKRDSVLIVQQNY
jgi:hypothetical protein